MPITLPYDFDTSRVYRTILKGAVGLELVIAAGAVYSLATGHGVAAFQLGLSGAVLLVFGRIIFRHSDGSIGTLGPDSVVVHRGSVYGLRLPGPSGAFPLERFKAVRVEHVAGPGSPDVPGGGRISACICWGGMPGRRPS